MGNRIVHLIAQHCCILSSVVASITLLRTRHNFPLLQRKLLLHATKELCYAPSGNTSNTWSESCNITTGAYSAVRVDRITGAQITYFHFLQHETYLPSRASVNSASNRPTRKCCCLNATDNSAMLLAGVSVSPDAELRDDIDVVGEDGSEGYKAVGNGRFKVT